MRKGVTGRRGDRREFEARNPPGFIRRLNLFRQFNSIPRPPQCAAGSASAARSARGAAAFLSLLRNRIEWSLVELS